MDKNSWSVICNLVTQYEWTENGIFYRTTGKKANLTDSYKRSVRLAYAVYDSCLVKNYGSDEQNAHARELTYQIVHPFYNRIIDYIKTNTNDGMLDTSDLGYEYRKFVDESKYKHTGDAINKIFENPIVTRCFIEYALDESISHFHTNGVPNITGFRCKFNRQPTPPTFQ